MTSSSCDPTEACASARRSYDAIALLDDDRAMILRNVRPAFRVATDARLHPKLWEKLPPPPSGREDIAFTPIMCDLVPCTGIGEATTEEE